MTTNLRILLIEDLTDDALLVGALRNGELNFLYKQVDDACHFRQALTEGPWDIIISDYFLPQFTGLEALKIVKETVLDIPFIVVSGTSGEDIAVSAMKAGAHDYILKSNLDHLIPAIERELKEASERSERKRTETALEESERFIRSTLDSLFIHIAILDEYGNILYTNRAWRESLGPEGCVGQNGSSNLFNAYEKAAQQLGQPEYSSVIDGIRHVISRDALDFTLEHLCKGSGGTRWFKVHVTRFIGEGPVRVVVAREDITERKKMEHELEYRSLYDDLTGLHNRLYFETEMRRLEKESNDSIGIIVCDVDGLKLVNDTLGHDTGDVMLMLAAGVIRASMPETACLNRIGGDEFAVLLTNVTQSEVEEYSRAIRNRLAQANQKNLGVTVSLSVGFAVRQGSEIILQDLFKEADNSMYREKLHRSQSARSAIVNTVMKLLEARDFITEGHADRMQGLAAALAAEIGLPESKISDLRLLAQFHDIGKVGIPDKILLKSGKLNPEEYVEMQRHCEIGYRIAQSSPDLVPLAEYILKHHEWWNGQGYPLALSGEEIPLECRILSVVDAFDAMTSNRPYRKAMTEDEAFSELRRNAGVQFDPNLVEVFIHLMQQKRGSYFTSLISLIVAGILLFTNSY